MGSYTACKQSMDIMLSRSTSCGARLNTESLEPLQAYEFLGEAYDHKAKTRALTKKFVAKAATAYNELQCLLASATSKTIRMTAKQVFALVGSICYAAEVLDINLSRSVNLLREHGEIAREAARRGTWHHATQLTTVAATEAIQLLHIATTNTPVHVTHGRRPPHDTRTNIEIFVDASRWGWGAVVLINGRPLQFSEPWAASEHAAHDLGSSVTAEPLAVRKILCRLPIATCNVTVHTDHEGLVWAACRSYSLIPTYNAVLQLRDELLAAQTTVNIEWIPGSKNPADHLSRGVPPILNVTSIGLSSLG
jgi:hypothetical protein